MSEFWDTTCKRKNSSGRRLRGRAPSADVGAEVVVGTAVVPGTAVVGAAVAQPWYSISLELKVQVSC